MTCTQINGHILILWTIQDPILSLQLLISLPIVAFTFWVTSVLMKEMKYYEDYKLLCQKRQRSTYEPVEFSSIVPAGDDCNSKEEGNDVQSQRQGFGWAMGYY
jgi:hypothetical protein